MKHEIELKLQQWSDPVEEFPYLASTRDLREFLAELDATHDIMADEPLPFEITEQMWRTVNNLRVTIKAELDYRDTIVEKAYAE